MYICGIEQQDWECAIARDIGNECVRVTELHHAWIHNSIINRQRYPLLIHSVWNLFAVNNNWHMKFSGWGRKTLLECDKIETYLRENPEISKLVNMEGGDFENIPVWSNNI